MDEKIVTLQNSQKNTISPCRPERKPDLSQMCAQRVCVHCAHNPGRPYPMQTETSACTSPPTTKKTSKRARDTCATPPPSNVLKPTSPTAAYLIFSAPHPSRTRSRRKPPRQQGRRRQQRRKHYLEQQADQAPTNPPLDAARVYAKRPQPNTAGPPAADALETRGLTTPHSLQPGALLSPPLPDLRTNTPHCRQASSSRTCLRHPALPSFPDHRNPFGPSFPRVDLRSQCFL